MTETYRVLRMEDGGRAFTDFRPKGQWQIEEMCGKMDSREFRAYMSGHGATKELGRARRKAYENVMVSAPFVKSVMQQDACCDQLCKDEMHVGPPAPEHTGHCSRSACHVAWNSDGIVKEDSDMLLGLSRKEAAIGCGAEPSHAGYTVTQGPIYKLLDAHNDAYGGIAPPLFARDVTR